jgi:hypothetical protein
MRVRIAVAMFAVVALLAVSLALMAVTGSAVPGWIAVGSLFAWMVGRLMLTFGPGGSDDDLDVDL